MKSEDREKFLEVVIGFAELKGKALSAPALELYWRALRHWTLEDFRAAAEQLILTCEFMPVPKDFEDLRKAGRMTSGEAFAMARGIVADAWERDFPTLTSGDPRVDATVRAIGGWRAIAMSTAENIGFLERRFTEHFETLSDAEDVREAVPRISGPSRLEGPQIVTKLLVRGA